MATQIVEIFHILQFCSSIMNCSGGGCVGILITLAFPHLGPFKPIPVAERSKVWVCSQSPAGIAGSNPAGDMDVLFVVIVIYCQAEVSATG